MSQASSYLVWSLSNSYLVWIQLVKHDHLRVVVVFLLLLLLLVQLGPVSLLQLAEEFRVEMKDALAKEGLTKKEGGSPTRTITLLELFNWRARPNSQMRKPISTVQVLRTLGQPKPCSQLITVKFG